LPARYSPVRDRARAVKRRNLVMRRMVAEGYLDVSVAERLVTEPIVLARRDSRRETGPHFNEAVRRLLQESYGTSALYGGGLLVKTTLDRRLQRIAEDAVRAGLRSLDKRQGWRPDAVRRVPGGEDPKNWAAPAWATGIADGRVTDGIVLEADLERAVVRVGERTGTLSSGAISWTGKRRPDRLLRSGDVIRVRVLASRGTDGLELALEQEPEAEAALVALDPTTGEVLALVGGFDFTRSEYDRATQARRQAGSLFKPFVYAAALEQGWTLADTLVDAPTVFLDRRKPVPYQPENFSRRYYGAITLRRALEKSINIATVRLLERVGPDSVIRTARRLGVESTLRPYPSLALGAFELSLLEVTSAYGALANRGLHLEPHWVEEVRDRQGRTIHRTRPRVREAVSPQVAYLINQALLGVVRHGTGKRAGQVLDHTLAGKTGTTDDNTDAWFVGYSPRLVVGVWVGHDEPKSLGRDETGARAALPIWIDFMGQALAGEPDVPFAVPEGIATSPIDPDTGLRPRLGAGCGEYIVESFIEGSEPSRLCSAALHEKLRFPHPFQHHPLDTDGALQVPRDTLARLLAQEQDVVFDIESQTLVAFGRDGAARLAVDELPERGFPDRDALPFEAGERTGTDGRPVTLIWFEPEPRRASRH
jgi:penicillin-binding protein 1A